jgi:hypothetical protein
MLVVGMALAGNAAAAPLWLVCLEGSGLTKFSTNQCTTASSSGKWQSSGLSSGKTDTVRFLALSLKLEDTGVGASVECPDAGVPGSGMALIEGSNKGKITKLELSEPEKEGCKVVKGFLTCTTGKLTKISALHLPWTTETFETESKTLSQIKNSGAGAPGWSITCGGATDECVEEESKPEFIELHNKITSGVALVSAKFEDKRKGKCSLGGKETGNMAGAVALLLGNGNGLSIAEGGGVAEREGNPPAPATSCPITSEGVAFDATVTAGNETTLRENVVNSTWGPEGENESCKEVSEFNADVTGGKITMAQKEEYKKSVEEAVVPGVQIYTFKWHRTGGSTFTTLGVATSAGELEFEPIGTWEAGSPTITEEPVKESKGVVEMTRPLSVRDPIFRFVTLSSGTVTQRFNTPDLIHINTPETALNVTNYVWDTRLALTLVEEKVVTEGGVECLRSKVKERTTQFFGAWEDNIEKTYRLCANGENSVI